MGHYDLLIRVTIIKIYIKIQYITVIVSRIYVYSARFTYGYFTLIQIYVLDVLDIFTFALYLL